MSQPTIPNISPDISITRDEAITLIIASIAMEELALSHIINAEGEKIEFVLGTLTKETSPPATIADVIAIDTSVRKVLNTILKKEILLSNKLESVLDP